MVLEETSDGFVYNEAPASDVDAYGSSAASTRGEYINAQPPPNQILIPFDQLPRPSFLSLSNHQDLRRLTASLVRQRCDAAAKLLNRPVRKEEAEAFAYSSAQAIKVSTLGTSVGGAFGGFRFWRTMDKCSFPGGWAPSMTDEGRWKYNKIGPFEGVRARMIWQITRLHAQAAVWVIAAQIFFATYGLSVLTVRIGSDHRLREYNEALRKQAQQPRPPRAQDISGTTQPETFEQRRQRRNVQETAQARRPAQQQHDDASPTGGLFQTENSTLDVQSELMSDRQTAVQAQKAWASNTTTPQQTSTPTNVRPQSQQTQDPLDTMSTPNADVKPAGSAWERLRQQALAGKSTSTDRST